MIERLTDNAITRFVMYHDSRDAAYWTIVLVCLARYLRSIDTVPLVWSDGATEVAMGVVVQRMVVGFLVVVSSLNARAQSASTGALTGVVSDPTGAVLPNARITLRNKGTNEQRTANTDQDGPYRFSLLPPGEYGLRVEAGGFTPLAERDVLIQITEVRSIAIQLAIAGLNENVVVTAPSAHRDSVARDVGLPGMSGPDLQLELKRRGLRIPIVFITAQVQKSLPALLMGRGAVACLLKPFNDTALLEAVHTALGRT